MTLSAWQHIYANVERDRSPTNTAGFQTLYFSHEGLNRDDIAEIEERVFYVFGEPNPIKRVFFRLKSDKVCIGQIVPVEGRDAAGREGLYIAHTLIFPTTAFQEAGVNPMDFFNSGLFATSLDDAISRADPASGNIDPIEIKRIPQAPQKTDWNTDDFRKLVQLAINHEALSKDRYALALVGSIQHIENTLTAILMMVPPQLLPYCTFDTFFERGGNLSFTYCWCVGFHSRPGKPIYCVVDAAKKTIFEPSQHTNPATTYGRWVDAGLASNKMRDIVINKREAYQIAAYLDAAKSGTVEDDPNILTSFDAALLAAVQHPV